ncbi:transketolase, partial [Candidatus Pacearchaeota archaeon]|nr:transketolase [Candidatus Pacearchaeota archaeon]
HAAPALYAVLSRFGMIKREELFTLRQIGSKLQGHPVKNPELGIEVSTGSLGMGLSFGVGCALTAKLDNSDKTIFVLLGDGELNEGVIWEAAMSASHYKLDNLIAIVDRNGLQSDGSTEKIMALEPLADKWKAFGWDVKVVDGHNINEIFEALKDSGEKKTGGPLMIIANTVKGKGVYCLENTPESHHTLPDRDEIERVREDLAC